MPRLLLTALAFAAIAGLAVSEDAAPGPLSKEQLQHNRVRVAAVQMTGNWFWQGNDDSPDETLETVLAYIDRAASDDVDLICFPELLLGKFRVPNSTTEAISKKAREHQINVIAGCFEILDDVGNYSNSSLVFNREGKIIGRYQKMHEAVGEAPYLWPPLEDDPEWCWTAGTTFPVFDLDFGRIGIITCYDGLFPEPARILALKGAEIIIWPNARGGSVEDYIVRTMMAQNRVHVVSTNKAVGAGTIIAEWPNKIKQETTQPEEAYLVADLELTNLRIHRKNAREFFQRKPALYAPLAEDLRVWELYENLEDPSERALNLIAATPRPTKAPENELEAPAPLELRLKANWMEHWVSLRLPEVLESSLGLHFTDHPIPGREFPPAPTVTPWQHDPRIDEYWYELTTPDGLHLRASARLYRDRVYLEVVARNNTASPLEYVRVTPSLRLLEPAPSSGVRPWKEVFSLESGALRPIESVADSNWVALRNLASPIQYSGPAESATWQLSEHAAEENLLVSVSRDGKHLIGYAWDFGPELLVSNGNNGSLFTGPAPMLELAPGASATRRGIIYFMENDTDALVARFRKDKTVWHRWPRRPEEPHAR